MIRASLCLALTGIDVMGTQFIAYKLGINFSGLFFLFLFIFLNVSNLCYLFVYFFARGWDLCSVPGLWGQGQGVLRETTEQSALSSGPWGSSPARPLSLRFCLLPTALKGAWQSGFFDQGSFKEILAPWAQTVVTGRAR